jgi:hypothetical protein
MVYTQFELRAARPFGAYSGCNPDPRSPSSGAFSHGRSSHSGAT